MNFNDREKIVELTPLWRGERLPDGRPKVEDKYLDALYGMTLEEVWKPIFVLGYEHKVSRQSRYLYLLPYTSRFTRGAVRARC